ncbi:hypothetical protein L1987_26038 [Smallanthus sonchifolius]|uniref:Uncharacterized protein n=1 Tax=Smallanthus sonchifolius TaxID=185202 RepID=A0ACB9I8R7_9ASTR|nr:hypothetical protein L1987_26038 [Smallanthus sonchifolius]
MIELNDKEEWELMQCKDWERRKWKKRRVCAIRDFPPGCGPANHINSNQTRNEEPEEEEPGEEESGGEKLDDTNNKDLERMKIAELEGTSNRIMKIRGNIGC